MTEDTTPITRGTGNFQDLSKSSTVFPVPEAKTYQMNNGLIRIELAEFSMTVAEWSMVDASEEQLIRIYRAYYS